MALNDEQNVILNNKLPTPNPMHKRISERYCATICFERDICRFIII